MRASTLNTLFLLSTLSLSFSAYAVKADDSKLPFECRVKEAIYDRSGDLVKEFPEKTLKPSKIPTQFGFTRWTLGKIEFIEIAQSWANQPVYSQMGEDISYNADYVVEDKTLTIEAHASDEKTPGFKSQVYNLDRNNKVDPKIKTLNLVFNRYFENNTRLQINIFCELL